MSKYLLRKNEERLVCVVCNKTFIRKKGSRTKTCSKKCGHRLSAITRRNKYGI